MCLPSFLLYLLKQKSITMDAKVARETAKQVNLSESTSQYSEIKSEIKESALKGEFKTYYYDFIKTEVRAKLEEEGYTVVSTNFRNEQTVTISW